MGSTTLSARKAFGGWYRRVPSAFKMVSRQMSWYYNGGLKGYKWEVLCFLGDPLYNAQALDTTTGGTGASQRLAFGDHNDGRLFSRKVASKDLPLTTNTHDEKRFHANRLMVCLKRQDDVRKNKAAQWCLYCGGGQRVVTGDCSRLVYNRRIPLNTKWTLPVQLGVHKMDADLKKILNGLLP